MQYVNNGPMPGFLARPQAPAPMPMQLPAVGYGPAAYYQPSGGAGSTFIQSNATSDPIYNLKVLATNVWSTLSTMLSSLWASAKRAFGN